LGLPFGIARGANRTSSPGSPIGSTRELSAWSDGEALVPQSIVSFPQRNTERSCTMSEDMKAELERLRAENAALKKTGSKGISLKVSPKGGLSIYGLGRFPVTLYKEQWVKLLELSDEIKQFMRDHDAELKTK
jgi:hypothetical protein